LTVVLEFGCTGRYVDNFLPISGSEGGCGQAHSREGVAFALGIITAPRHVKHRAAIRKTWLRLPNKYNHTFVYRFFIGTQHDGTVDPKVSKEADQFGDIVVIGAREGYANIKYKAIAIFRWGVRQCGAYYVMRANDDVFLRLEPLMAKLYSQPPTLVYAGLRTVCVR
jgi:hypothetical protein